MRTEKTKFQNKVYLAVKKIPYGRVSTYAIIAEITGNKNAVRAVGSALKKNFDESISCHRVVLSSGFLGQYNRGRKEKIKKLRREGVKVEKNKIDLGKFLF